MYFFFLLEFRNKFVLAVSTILLLRLQSLADLAFVEGKRVKWSLKLGDDNEFYLHLKDIEYVDSSLDLKSFLRPKANRTPDEAFGLFDLPPELQLLILRELSSRDLNSCRLVCRWMNQFILHNWTTLRSRHIGSVDFIPDCPEVWGLYYDYSKALVNFQHAAIGRLLIYYGVLSSSLLLSLSNALSQSHISVKTLIIYNCRCDCTVKEFVDFIKSTDVKILAIDVFDMHDFGKSLVKEEAIQNLTCSFIYSNGDDVISGIVVNSLIEDSSELSGFSRLLTDWGHGCMELLHFHMNIDTDGVESASVIWQDSGHFRCLRGCILKNCDNQELYVEAKNGRLVLTPVTHSDSQDL